MTIATCCRSMEADKWFLDDGDILCHPVLVAPYLKAFDGVNVRVRSQRSRLEQDVIYNAAPQGQRGPRLTD